ncbi:MAG: hypothetical protein A2915_00345 [Candidatus Yanofskybacteria bacterium RIFCSPLOWO2_01_FULL_41_34]|uniref:Uncharacterized protein n=1 Tax=Candidatus Yanofskybacteria bacterium RIFCSPHIGHO2_01_FULL_41_26 TaxID=1802661 RepID=A0A1F8EEJ0_9BACT|nr:MAG: hypothetical protein A2649_02380 [Candidatus Yanofskybacteria bacterium RIFCSPHIGHO2_01_FULL_41_26]OGN22353.1 MAG: hypothetical protein A2915_00345 [Candidatus Yanofskybacteria bacterium RIFCSPLOWO2_01_FULL_41_34]
MTTTWLLIGLLVYLLVGFILRNYSPWGKKYYTEWPTCFTLLWIVPAFGTVLFYAALALIFVCIVLAGFGGAVCTLITLEKNEENWPDVLIDQFRCFMKTLTPNQKK